MEKVNKAKAQKYVPVRKLLKAAALCQKEARTSSQTSEKNTLSSAA